METEVFYNKEGKINRTETLVIDLNEYIKPKRTKPSKEVIMQLRDIKKRRKENRFYPTIDNTYKSIEITIGELVNEQHRGLRRKKQVKEIVNLLKQMQIEKGYLDFNRFFLDNIFKNYSNLTIRTRQNLITELINKCKNKRERIITKRFLVNDNLERVYKERKTIIEFYNFT